MYVNERTYNSLGKLKDKIMQKAMRLIVNITIIRDTISHSFTESKGFEKYSFKLQNVIGN